MIHTRAASVVSCVLFAYGAFGCSAADKAGSISSASSADSPSDSEVAVSVVSGALNNTTGSSVALYAPPPKPGAIEQVLSFLSPIGTARAAEWTCTGGTLTPSFTGPAANPYAYTPVSCGVTWNNGRTASSDWSGPFTLDYGAMCDTTHPFMEKQAAACVLTRTTGANGDTRTITGPDGNSYAIAHDTNGAGTGWDSSVVPAPNDDGVQATCGDGGCATSRTIVINGSHLTGTVTIGKDSVEIWNHTVTSGTGGIAVTGAGADRLVSGEVIVQHNILKYTSTTTFSSVGYTEPLCCFPTTGSVSTTFSRGADVGKTESIAFTTTCGEATLTRPDGVSEPLTFVHCL